ncbi:MAG TPA: STAS/SEC14 domain-containing protein [Acidimicrobiia bacterium]
MIERIDSPENVLAFRAVGTIQQSDYETVLEPAVHQMLADRDELRLVYLVGDEFDGYTFGAGWEDAKLGIGHLSKWKRCAIVSDKDWVRHLVGMFRWMMPGEMKIFPVADLAAALEWAAA